MKSIVTLTMNPSVDKSTAVESVASEIKLRCESPRFDPGGGGINVSRATKKLGGESVALYTKGGTTGELLSSLLEEEDIQQKPIPIEGMTRESLTVFEKTTTLQYRFGMPGEPMSAEECEQALDMLFSIEADYIVASGSLPPNVPIDFYAKVAKRGAERGARVIVDTSGEALLEAAKEGVYLLKPNLHELENLSGKQAQSEEELHQAALTLTQGGEAEAVVVSLGKSGAILVTDDTFTHYNAPFVPIQSKVGAGDSMVAGIVLSLARGNDLADAVRFGVAAGSAAVMTPGTMLCRREDTEKLYEKVTMQKG